MDILKNANSNENLITAENCRVCIVSAYFGSLPNTFPLFLKSIEYNPSIDFLIVTDQNNIVHNLKNLRVVNMNFDSCVELIKEKLEMDVAITRPYKLCDLKPVYGKIFADYLTDYHYWGHCDMDLMFGDIRSFLVKYNLKEYDKFLHQGHLAIYKNTDECNDYYKKSGSYYSYEEVFTNENIYVFDEYNRINGIYKYNKFPLFEKVIFANINPAFTRFKICRGKNYMHQVFYWEGGHVYRASDVKGKIIIDEFMYIHLLKRRMPDVSDEILNADAYYITSNGYFLKGENISEEIKQYDCYQGLFKEIKQIVRNEYNYNWSKSGLKRRLTEALFKCKSGRKILGREFK